MEASDTDGDHSDLDQVVDFQTVSTTGLESSPFAPALAGLRANEARYFRNKYGHVFTVTPAGNAQRTVDWVHRILKEERDIVIQSPPLEATAFEVEGIRMAYVFYESGLSINVMYTIDDAGKRAVGFKLCEGMPIPDELASKFKFARQNSKLAGTIRGSYFTIKNAY
ncbi:MAG TPA: phage tail protein [Actinomycetota bacterium]|nr:phage tail protein [Actinomycetota bacterium]